ncbi:MAG: response regulator [Deltaproteobacteria bacterium]|nr:response regulator [Deltaproteobacteria bacterium]
MDTNVYQEIRDLFDDYLRMYTSRDDRLATYFSEDFSGFTGCGDTLVKNRDEWVAITRQDFAQIKEPLRINLKDLAIQSLSDTVAVATGFFTIHLPIEEHILSRETARLVLIFSHESAGWKISHSSISIPYHLVRNDEVYPLQELAERNRFLEELVAERTLQFTETNEKLQQTNIKLAHEIAGHQQTEDVLRESEAHYRLLTESASDVVWRLDSEYRFTYISPADERLRGYKADEVIGHHVFESFDDDGIATVKKLAYLRHEVEQSKGTQTDAITFEARHRCKDGTWIWAEVRYASERDANGTVTGFYGMTREITERKLAEDELRLAKEAAEEAHKAKSQFLASMSHEIRTPLNSLIGFSTLACMATDPGKLDQYHSILVQSSRSLMSLVDGILDMSKIESGQMELESVPFCLRQLVGDLKEQYCSQVKKDKVTFRAVVADDVPDWFLGDPVRLRQILSNLFANAVKFTEKGAISCRIKVANPGDDEAPPLISFEVRDSGIGIPEQSRDQLFIPFRQLDPTITRKYGGTGLGLAIVHNLVEMMHGNITVESQEGEGSCFFVELPFRKTDAVPETLTTAAVLSAGTVLVIEDNDFNRRLLGDILAMWGQKVILAEDGWQALQSMEQQRFDLILLDIRMPGIDGIEVARRIRLREQERSEMPVPIIAITADADTATREACLSVGINAVLSKPVIPEQLARVIAAHCEEAIAVPLGDKYLLNVQTSNDLGKDPERARQYRELLLKDINDELQSLQVALERDNRDELSRCAHTLKGLCGHLKNRDSSELAEWLQQNAPSATPDQLQRTVEQLMIRIGQ